MGGGIVPGTGLLHLLGEIEHRLHREGTVQGIGVRLARPPSGQYPLQLTRNVWYARDPALRYAQPPEDVLQHLGHQLVDETDPVHRGDYLDRDLHLVATAQTTSGGVIAGKGIDLMSGPDHHSPDVGPAHPSGRQLGDAVHLHHRGLHHLLDVVTPDLPV